MWYKTVIGVRFCGYIRISILVVHKTEIVLLPTVEVKENSEFAKLVLSKFFVKEHR